jgi:hypothetical protein
MSRTLRNKKGKAVPEKSPKKHKKVKKKSDTIEVKKEIEEELDEAGYNEPKEEIKPKKQSVIKTMFLKSSLFKRNKK